jgi:hypothetical protein
VQHLHHAQEIQPAPCFNQTVPLLTELKKARRIVLNLVRSRTNRREMERLGPGVAVLPPNSIEIAVYFADARVNLYQIRQWYAPLAELAKTHPVAIISRSPGAALDLLNESPVPVVYLRTVLEVENFIDSQTVKVIFYVNQNSKNFQMFRYGRMWHVFINHGESDKMYMTTNQFKAYDYSLVAGEAARDRLRRKLWDYDFERRTLMIGRPQADHFAGSLPYPPDDRTVVLYSPTWEGDRAAAAYGSVATHGEAIAAALLSDGGHRLIYRPHPRTGVLDPETRQANLAIIAAIAAANANDPTAHHIFDDGPDLGWQLAAADVAIADISAMVYDRLATGKPLIITRPVAPEAEIDETGYLGAAEWLEAAEAPNIVAVAERVQHDAAAQQRLNYWVGRHFGDSTPGSSTRRFHEAVETLLAEWDANALLHADDLAVREPDRFDSDEVDAD